MSRKAIAILDVHG
jgi:hypothetical protein